MIKFENSPKFEKNKKKLIKKYRSLDDDLKILKMIITTNHIPSGRKIDEFFEITNKSGYKLSCKELQFWKIKKIACKSLKGKGGKTKLRIIYVFIEKESKIIFLEFYFKGSQENESRDRITNSHNDFIITQSIK